MMIKGNFSDIITDKIKKNVYENTKNIYNEIKGAQEFLRDNIGVRGDYLAYPFGWYSNKVINIANELNIKAAVTIQKCKISYKSNRYKLKRIEVDPMSIEEFEKLLS